MRALCGAIITAGALLGLGLAAIGVGTRYATYTYKKTVEGQEVPDWVKFSQMDVPLIIIVVLLVATMAVGLAITILGLAYHHHRSHHEHLRAMAGFRPHDTTTTTTSPPAPLT